MPTKFIRRNWSKASRLGKGRKKKQVWRAPKGRHNKIRKKRKGYPTKVMVGFKQTPREQPVFVNNMKDFEKLQKGQKIILGKIGMKKKIEIAKRAKEKGITLHNMKITKILKNEKRKETKQQENKK